MLCDAVNAYCCQFEVYTGKSHDVTVSILDDLIFRMVDKYRGKGHHLFMDNFYSSPMLFASLWDCYIGCTGTVRKSRKGIPKDIKEEAIRKHEWTSRTSKQILLVKYSDKKELYLMSTVETDTPIGTGRFKKPSADAPEKEIMMPKLVDDYNMYMNGVDRSDQMSSYFALRLKTMKWWKRLHFHVFNLVVVNSYILYKEYTGNLNMSHRMFRVKLVQSLVDVPQGDLVATPVAPRAREVGAIFRVKSVKDTHFIEKMPVTASSGRAATKRCVVCTRADRKRWALLTPDEQVDLQQAQKKKKKCRTFGHETTFWCSLCKVALCVVPCFKIYHTEVNFISAYLKHAYNFCEAEFLQQGNEESGEDDLE